MATVTIKFDMFEESEELESALKGGNWKMLVWEFDQYLRSEYKHNGNESFYSIREKLREMISDSNLSLD